IYEKRIDILNAQQSESLVSDNLNNITLDYEILDNTISDDNISLDTNNATDLDISFQDNNKEERKTKHAHLTKDNSKNIVATSKITKLTSLIEFHTEYDTTELCSSYILNHPLLESLEIKSCADYRSYSNNHAARNFIDAIGRVIEEVISSKNLAIISKHISKNVPVYRYLGMIELTKETANAIVKELNIFIYAKNLPINRLINMGSDGASIMLGCNNSVAAQLKQQNPYLIEIHCISHHLALASEDAAASIPYLSNYNNIVRNLYSYFSKSYIRMAHLKMLSLSNVVSNLHHIINSVIQALYEDYEISTTAHTLYNMIDQNFLLTTYFLADILNDLQCLTLIFQSDYISLYEIKIQLNTVIQKITSDFLEANGQESTWGNHLYQFLEKENIISNYILFHIQQFA
ncbi:23017_t:CDS:2, partial [Cetraspora pellucida]